MNDYSGPDWTPRDEAEFRRLCEEAGFDDQYMVDEENETTLDPRIFPPCPTFPIQHVEGIACNCAEHMYTSDVPARLSKAKQYDTRLDAMPLPPNDLQPFNDVAQVTIAKQKKTRGVHRMPRVEPVVSPAKSSITSTNSISSMSSDIDSLYIGAERRTIRTHSSSTSVPHRPVIVCQTSKHLAPRVPAQDQVSRQSPRNSLSICTQCALDQYPSSPSCNGHVFGNSTLQDHANAHFGDTFHIYHHHGRDQCRNNFTIALSGGFAGGIVASAAITTLQRHDSAVSSSVASAVSTASSSTAESVFSSSGESNGNKAIGNDDFQTFKPSPGRGYIARSEAIEQVGPQFNLWFENGRGYCNFRRGQYFMPVDQKEQKRLDIVHTMIKAVRPKSSRLHHCPFNDRDPQTGEPARILDVGHGTGIWCLEMSEQYQDASFYGFDMANMDPSVLHPKVDLRSNVDYETPWALGERSFDFIHLQMALGSVGNWPMFYERIFRHLKLGGWLEHVEIDWAPRCQNGTLNPRGLFKEWWEKYVGPPYGVIGRPITYNENTGQLLGERGFTNIEHREYRIPTSGWSHDKAEHLAGHWWVEAMDSSEGRGYGLEAMSLAVLTRIQRWSPEHARRLCQDVMKEATDPNVNVFNVLHIWWAQKPG